MTAGARRHGELGTDVEVKGGPYVALPRSGPPERICGSGVMEGGRFILRAGNDLVPCTPVEHIAAMYEAGPRFGKYG